MFPAILLLASLVSLGLGVPLELDPQHDMKQFLSTRIVGGIEAPPGYGDHMAALVWGTSWTHLMCGATIITTQHLLTAAHCITPMVVWGELLPSFRAVIGSYRWDSNRKNIGFKGYVNHEEYCFETIKNDIGFLIVDKEIVLGHNVAIIPLKFDWVGGGVKAFATGWGRLGVNSDVSDTLQLLWLHTISPRECYAGIQKEAEGWWGGVPPHDPKIEICTFHSVGHGMCNGDSGSALVQKDTRQQIGIVSWGFPCARGAPDVYVRISAYKKWFLEKIGPHIIHV